MDVHSKKILTQGLEQFVGRCCSGYMAGGAAGSVITIEFEPRVPRVRPLRNSNLSEAQRTTESLYIIFVKCVWRLDSKSKVVCGAWDDNSEEGPMIRGLDRLVGRKLGSFELSVPGFDVSLSFEGLTFRIFCDQVNEEDENDNYILFTPEEIVTVGVRSHIEREQRTSA